MTSPLELLSPRDERYVSAVSKLYGPIVCGGIGFAGVCLLNFLSRRPAYSGIQRHIVFTGVGAAIGQYLEDYRADYLAEKDAVLRHYVELHPEDFPTPERKKFGEVFEPWIPIR